MELEVGERVTRPASWSPGAARSPRWRASCGSPVRRALTSRPSTPERRSAYVGPYDHRPHSGPTTRLRRRRGRAGRIPRRAKRIPIHAASGDNVDRVQGDTYTYPLAARTVNDLPSREQTTRTGSALLGMTRHAQLPSGLSITNRPAESGSRSRIR